MTNEGKFEEHSDDNPFLLGPFYDVDEARTEIIPACFEEAHEPLLLCMSKYEVRSNEPTIDGTQLDITNKDITAFVQQDWNRVFGPEPPSRGFLLMCRAGAFAAGRIAEEILLQKLLLSARLLGAEVDECLLFSEAQAREIVGPRSGSQSDDLILILSDGRIGILESKAAFAGRRYLRRCIPKAASQLQATLAKNGGLGFAALALIDLKAHAVALVTATRTELLKDPTAIADASRIRLGSLA